MSRRNSLFIISEAFDESLDKKFRTLPSGKIQADFGTNVSFVKTGNNRNVDEFKRRFPTEYQIEFDKWFDTVHPY